MTIAERRNYLIAISLSILFHATLLLITLPQTLGFGSGGFGNGLGNGFGNGPGNQMNIVSAGLMDFNSGGSNPGSGSVTSTELANEAIEEVVTQPDLEKTKPETKLAQPKIVSSPKTIHEPEIIHQEKVVQQRKAEQPKNEPKLQPKLENLKTTKPNATVAAVNQNVKAHEGRPGVKPGETGNGNGSGSGNGSGTGTGNGTGKGNGSGTGTGNGTGSGNGNGSGSGGGRSIGTGGNMVAGGLEVQFYYPKNARNENKEGDVQFRAFFNTDGSLEKIEKTQSSGDQRLDNAAARYFQRSLKFKPFPEKYYIDVMIMFRIDQDEPVVKWLHAETRH